MSFEVCLDFLTEPCDVFCLRVADGTHDSPKESETGKLLVTSKNVKDGRLTRDSAYRISTTDFDAINKRSKVDQWDLLLTMIGTVGEVCLVEMREPDFAIKNVGLLKCGDELRARWLYYFLRSPLGQSAIEQRKKGSTQQYISLTEIRQLPIPYPSQQQEMKSIVEHLAALDDRITLLRETNATLEAIAQALFKSWFVDFDPVRAKLVGRAPKGIDEATAALFPDRFEEPELGLVPRGWCTFSCQDLFDVRDGTHESPKPALVGYPLVTSKHITSGRVNLQETYLISESDYTAISKRSKVNRLDVLITMIGTVGLSTILLDERNDFAIKNIGLFKTSEAPQFAYFFSILLKSPKMQLYLAARLAGTTQKYLSLTALREMRLLVPTEPILVEFSKIVSPLFDGVQRNHEQAQNLATLRDTLLPRLISGQLRLPDAELQIQKDAI